MPLGRQEVRDRGCEMSRGDGAHGTRDAVGRHGDRAGVAHVCAPARLEQPPGIFRVWGMTSSAPFSPRSGDDHRAISGYVYFSSETGTVGVLRQIVNGRQLLVLACSGVRIAVKGLPTPPSHTRCRWFRGEAAAGAAVESHVPLFRSSPAVSHMACRLRWGETRGWRLSHRGYIHRVYPVHSLSICTRKG